MKIYLKNKTSNKISTQEADSFFSLSKNIRDSNDEATQQEADSFILQEVKDSKIAEIKANRKEANQKDLISIQANEITDNGNGSFTTTTNLVDFAFKTKRSEDELTSPSNLLNACLRGNTIRYSCDILNPSRKGYVEMTPTVAVNMENHLIIRGEANVVYANNLEKEINDCTTVIEVIVDGVVTVEEKTVQQCITEVNNIDITFI
tara:strand:- start:729 stop:1343 length:615 start_codon:yes stop_codon:yes gene_type:complete